jgi:hypothetical protein
MNDPRPPPSLSGTYSPAAGPLDMIQMEADWQEEILDYARYELRITAKLVVGGGLTDRQARRWIWDYALKLVDIFGCPGEPDGLRLSVRAGRRNISDLTFGYLYNALVRQYRDMTWKLREADHK